MKYFVGGKYREDTGRVCSRCKAKVWKSDNPEYSYQCFECDEDLYEFEVSAPQIEMQQCGFPPGP